MQQIQRPADWLTIGRDEVNPIQAMPMCSFQHASHHAMHCKGGDSVGTSGMGRCEDSLDCCVVVNGVNAYSQDALFTVIDHGAAVSSQRSTFW